MYFESRPSSKLQTWIESFWVMAPLESDKSFNHTVIPDHCTDLIFDLGQRAFSSFGGETTKVEGVMTRAALAYIEPNTCLLGIRFRPYAASRIFGFSARELLDEEVDLQTLGADDFNIRDELFEADSLNRRLEILVEYPDTAAVYRVAISGTYPSTNEATGAV